jgi:hypothetical protein
MKIFPYATTDGIIQTVELEKLRAELAETKKYLAEAVKRMEAVPCPPSAFTNTQWGFAKKKFISAAYEAAKSGDLPDPPLLAYCGKMYMRPCDRGAVLCDIDKQFDNDVLPEGDFVCEIRVWKGEQP